MLYFFSSSSSSPQHLIFFHTHKPLFVPELFGTYFITSALVSVLFWEELSPANLHVNELSLRKTETWVKKNKKKSNQWVTEWQCFHKNIKDRKDTWILEWLQECLGIVTSFGGEGGGGILKLEEEKCLHMYHCMLLSSSRLHISPVCVSILAQFISDSSCRWETFTKKLKLWRKLESLTGKWDFRKNLLHLLES